MKPLRPQTASAAEPPARLAPINGLRGIAILGVLYFHVVAGLWPADRVPLWLSPLVTSGWTGVNLFFILSGFVLFLPHVANARAMCTASDRLRFYRRRALRLLPLFYVAVAVQWPLAALHGTSGAGELFSVVSFRFIFDARSFGPSFNLPLWSIGAEVAFSALFPMLVLASRRCGTARILAGVAAAALMLRIVGYIREPGAEGVTFNTDMFLCRLDEFVLGMMMAQFYAARRLPRHPALCLAAGGVLILVAWAGFDLTARHVVPIVTHAALTDVLDAGFCLVLAAALSQGTRVAAALSWRPLQVLGMMCYSLYIWHWPLLNWLMPDRAAMPAGPFAAALFGFAALTVAIAALSYRFIEFGRVRSWRSLFLLDDVSRLAAPAVASPGLIPP